jgi:hypothetical protein
MQLPLEFNAESIAPYPSYEPDGISQSRYGYGLIRALSTGMDRKVRCNDSFAHRGHPLSHRYQVCIDASDDDNWLLRRQQIAPLK